MSKTAELVSRYLAHVATCCEPGTVVFYQKRLSPFLRLFGDRDISELTKPLILDYIERESKWSVGPKVGELKAPDTIRSTIVTWEQFQRWLCEQEILASPLTYKLKKPGGRKRELLPTRDETRLLLSDSPADFVTFYRSLRLTGARPGELCKAMIADFDRISGEIVIAKHKTARKTGKPRRIAVGHPALLEIINSQIGDRTEGHIYLRAGGQPWTVEAASAIFRAAKVRHSLRPGLVMYLSRHEHGTDLYKATGDIKSVADALGHSNISTTMRYTRVDSETLKKNQRLFVE